MKKISPVTKYILESMIPYTDANLRLAFKPRSFFYELSKKNKIKEKTVQSAYYRAIRQGLLEMDGRNFPRLTEKGRARVQLFQPSTLPSGARLLVIFDIPESERHKRDHLRTLLRELAFEKIQQSVWATKYDHRDYLAAEIKEYGLLHCVEIFEAVRIETH